MNLILCLIVVIAVIFYPRLNYNLKNKQIKRLNYWLNSIKTAKKIDLLDFWQFREFYSIGHFIYNPQYLMPYSILQIETLESSTSAIINFDSKLFTSADSIIDFELKPNFTYSARYGMIIHHDNHSLLIYFPEKKYLKLTMINSILEMKNIYGIIDFQGSEKLLNNKLWLTEAIIKLPSNYVLILDQNNEN